MKCYSSKRIVFLMLSCTFVGHSALAKVAAAEDRETAKSRSVANAPGVKGLARPSSIPQGTEQPKIVNSRDVLPPNLLKGQFYTVQPNVEADGFLYFFTVATKFGEMPAYGIDELRDRISELPAIAKMAGRSTGKKAAEGFKNSLKGTVNSTVNFVKNPISSLQALPGAVSKTVSDAAGSVGLTNDPDLEVPASNKDSDALLAKKAEAFADDFSDDLLGYSEAKRKIAQEYKVDPYSSNPLVQHQLIRLARAETGGSLATVAIPSPAVIDIMATANDLVWKVDEKSIIASSFKALIRLGVPVTSVERFLKNESYTRSEDAEFTKLIGNFANQKGLPSAVAVASRIKSRAGAILTLGALRALSRYRASDKTIEITGDYGVLAGVSPGHLIVPAPLDYVMWTDAMSKLTGAIQGAITQKGTGLIPTLYIPGTVSETLRQNFDKIGWKVTTGSKTS